MRYLHFWRGCHRSCLLCSPLSEWDVTSYLSDIEDGTDGDDSKGKLRGYIISCGLGLIEQAAHRAANQVDHGDEVGLASVAA